MEGEVRGGIGVREGLSRGTGEEGRIEGRGR